MSQERTPLVLSVSSFNLRFPEADRISRGRLLLFQRNEMICRRTRIIRVSMHGQFALVIVACFSLAIPLTPSGALEVGSVTQVPFVTVDKGFNSGIRERKFLVVKREQEWKKLWQAHRSTVNPSKKLPPVDFGQEMIIAAFLDEQRSGGYTVEITRIEENAEKRQLTVFWREAKPPAGSMVIQALTQPYHIVKVKKSELPVAFVLEG